MFKPVFTWSFPFLGYFYNFLSHLQFPDYLADNRSSLSEDKYKAYNKQCDLTRKICFKFEEEVKDKDTEVVKKARFQEVMAMMQVQ